MLSFELTNIDALDYRDFAEFQRNARHGKLSILQPTEIQTPEYYQWKYRTPWGAAKLSTAAVGRTLVAAIAAVPYPLTDGIKTRLAWQICDIATRLDQRRKGLFKRCMANLLSALPPDALLFCFPNAESFRPMTAVGFVPNGALRLWLSLAPLLAGRSRMQRQQDAVLIENFPPVETIPGTFEVSVDDAYLDWRFLRNPLASYRCVIGERKAAAVVRSFTAAGRPVSIIMLLTGADPERQGAALRAAMAEDAGRSWATIYFDSQWRGSRTPLFLPLPYWTLPRNFPIVCMGFGDRGLRLRTCDWDVF
jgi:hypothetical protein